MGISSAEAAALFLRAGAPVPKELHGEQEIKKHKYNARKKEVDGIVFASTSEAEAYLVLKLWKAADHIYGLRLQPRFVLQDGFRYAGKWHRQIVYVADFHFVDKDRQSVVVVDVKGIKTPVFRMKEKLFRAKFPDIDLQIWDRNRVKELSRL